MDKLEPFERVLVRDNDSGRWFANIYSHYEGERIARYACVCGNWTYCIPYAGNEHLLGTTNSSESKHEYMFGDWVEVSIAKKWVRAIYLRYNKTLEMHEIDTEDGSYRIPDISKVRPLKEDK